MIISPVMLIQYTLDPLHPCSMQCVPSGNKNQFLRALARSSRALRRKVLLLGSGHLIQITSDTLTSRSGQGKWIPLEEIQKFTAGSRQSKTNFTFNGGWLSQQQQTPLGLVSRGSKAKSKLQKVRKILISPWARKEHCPTQENGTAPGRMHKTSGGSLGQMPFYVE